jgi:TRAP-type C4-dicarboxylate transport system permease small subunit
MIRALGKVYQSLNLWLGFGGGVVLLGMMLLTTCDVIGRYVFNLPFTGAYEITEGMMVVIVFLFISHTQASKGHISIDFVVMQLPVRWRMAVDILTHLVSLLIVILLTYMSVIRWTELMRINEHTAILHLPISPFLLIMAFGFLVYSLELLKDVVKLFKGKEL